MIDESSPFHNYDPSSAGWLRSRKEQGLDILNEDLVKIIQANPDVVSDPLLRDLLVEGLRGQLHAKRGRKRRPSHVLRDHYVVALYDDLLPRLQARADRRREKGIRKARADYAPAELAYKVIGTRVRLKMEAVRNLVSSQKNR